MIEQGLMFMFIILAIALISGLIDGLFFRKKRKARQSYSKKAFMSNSEKKFFNTLKQLEKHGLIIVPQVNLASIVKKEGNSRYNTELFRNIDFGVFDRDYNVRLLIELNDSSHNQKHRQYRDIRVKEIVKSAGIPLMTFYTNKPNNPEYVISRIMKELKGSKDENHAK